ncbi:EspA/EspE family type VII secretion system effector [Mycobacterium marinum]
MPIEPPGEDPPLAAEGTPDGPCELCLGSLVCGWTLVLLGPWPGLLGDGPPERGDRLQGSASMFDDLGVRVAALDPHGSWRGGAAQAYGACTDVQCRNVMAMADLDRLTAQLVSAQAHAVTLVRDALSWLIYGVSGLALVCGALEWQGHLVWSFRIAIAVCGLALAIAAGFLIYLAITTSRNANEVQAATQRVTNMAPVLPLSAHAAVDCPTGVASPGAGLPPADWVSQVVVAGDHTAASPGLPDLGAAFAGLPGAPEFHLASGAGVGLPDFGAPGLPIPPLRGMPSLPDPGHLPDVSDLSGPPDVSAALAGLPTIAHLSTTLGQLGGLARPTSAASQLAATATQHAQMISTPAHRGAQQQTPLPGHRTPDNIDNSPDPESAAVATTTGQQAPADTHTRRTQQHLGLLG